MNVVPQRCAFLVLCSLPLFANAGAMYGTVRLNNAPLGGAQLTVSCPSFAAARETAGGASDASGSFALRVQATGRCEMRVQRGGQSGPPFPVYLSDKAIRFDLAVTPALARQ